MIKLLLARFAQIVIEPKDVDLPNKTSLLTDDTISRGLQLFFGVAGGAALVIITIAGLKYVFSQGNPQETAKAKDAIMYAVIGLIVCIIAYGIVVFVFTRI